MAKEKTEVKEKYVTVTIAEPYKKDCAVYYSGGSIELKSGKIKVSVEVAEKLKKEGLIE